MRAFLLALLASLVLQPASLGAQTLERIKETGRIVLGFRTDAAPLSYLGNNQPSGYTPNICFALAEKIGADLGMTDIEVIFRPVTTEDRFDRVASGEIDLLCGAATITLSRQAQVDFSIPVYVDGTTVALRQDGPETLAGLAGMKIGVRSGTTTEEALRNSLAEDGIEADVVLFADHPAGIAALEANEIEAYFADQSILMFLLNASERAAEFKVLEEILTIEKQGLAMTRGDADFRLVVDRGLSELYQSGSLRKTFEQTVPGARAGLALEAMFLLAPTLP
jgi:polar amino acid transport system substrate-binding protein/glutamate/aspartate transport system substrate-binding protein